MSEPIIQFRCGPDYIRDGGWLCELRLFPARRLMDRRDEGREYLVGLGVTVGLSWSNLRIMQGRWPGYRLWVRVRSDADEIATRLAASA